MAVEVVECTCTSVSIREKQGIAYYLRRYSLDMRFDVPQRLANIISAFDNYKLIHRTLD